jgi:hypothetical protein
MKWIKKGLIFNVNGEYLWNKSHAQVPFALDLGNGNVRIYYSTRDDQSCSSTSFIEVNKERPNEIQYIHNTPILQKGQSGYFDDSGTMPSWFVKSNDDILLYYTAWNRSESASYRLSIGLAVSKDNGVSFEKLFKGPILDRNIHDPIWVGQPCVIKEERVWKMWYLSCQKIEIINGIPEPFYSVKYAESRDGIDWQRNNITCLDFDENTDAIGRPCVWKEDGIYKMLHSNRKAENYRTNKKASYRICYSESIDGINWKDNSHNLNFVKSKNGWDCLMNEYCTIFQNEEGTQMVYNGDGFGKTGFGYATIYKF